MILWQPEPLNRNGSGRFGAVKSDSTHHFFGNACTKLGPLRFSQFSGYWLIFFCFLPYEFCLSLWKIARCSVILLLPLLLLFNISTKCMFPTNNVSFKSLVCSTYWIFLLEHKTECKLLYPMRGCRGCDRMVDGFATDLQSVPTTTKVVSSNPPQTMCTWYIIMW